MTVPPPEGQPSVDTPALALNEPGGGAGTMPDEGHEAASGSLNAPDENATDLRIALTWIPEKYRRVANARLDSLLALVAEAKAACNICGYPWPTHYEHCAYPANVRDKIAAEALVATLTEELDEALVALREEMAWDMGGVPENEWMARALKAEREAATLREAIEACANAIPWTHAQSIAEKALAAAAPTDEPAGE